MCEKGMELLDNYAFHFLEDVENPFLRMIAIGREVRCSPEYHYDNSGRRPAYLFQYTLSGGGIVKINGHEHLVDEGKAFFLKMPGEESYYFDKNRSTVPWEFIYIMFECHGAEQYCQYIENHLGQIISLPPYHEAVRLLFEIHSNVKEQKEQNPFILSSRAFAFLCLLCAIPHSDTASGSDLTARAQNHIQQNFHKPVGISDTANFLHVSPSHLSREFFKDTGVKPIDYLTRIRLKKAVELLSSSFMNVEDIGVACGFSCSNYFSKVFKKHMNMSPTQFRRYIQSEGYSRMQI